METFSALQALCAGNSPVTGEFPLQRPVTRSFDVFFNLCLKQRLSKQSRRRWFETPSPSLWRHCDVVHLKLFAQYNYSRNALSGYHKCTKAFTWNPVIQIKHGRINKDKFIMNGQKKFFLPDSLCSNRASVRRSYPWSILAKFRINLSRTFQVIRLDFFCTLFLLLALHIQCWNILQGWI